MWWRSRSIAALALAGALGLAGCGIQPLYGTTAQGSRLSAVMAGVDIAPIPGRVGQKLRSELIFKTTGGGTPAPTNFKLDIVIKESVSRELVEITGEAQQEVYELDATFKLVSRTDNKVILEGKATSRAAYERFQTIFSNVRARLDAENRAARTVAESIKVRIAAFLSQAS